MTPDLKLIPMDEIKAEEVKWLWYPYLPRGKLTIVQGDPGEGKTTFVLAVIAALTRGETLPESEQVLEPLTVIYQTAEDGLADTIKPRLDAAGADCSRVLVIDESQRELTLCDLRLEQAVSGAGGAGPHPGVSGKRCGHAPGQRGAACFETGGSHGGAHRLCRDPHWAHEQGAGAEVRL